LSTSLRNRAVALIQTSFMLWAVESDREGVNAEARGCGLLSRAKMKKRIAADMTHG
jgi:hypothetical protein